jgi:cytidylate kinase
MSIDTQGVVRAFVRAAEAGREHVAERKHAPTVIISRSMGSGGDTIARMLGERLNLEVYGSEVLNSVAKQAKVDSKLMSSLNEIAGQTSDAWLYATFFGKNVSRDDYVNHLVSTVRGLYRMGGVILGRGAYIILEGKPVLRVRITGSVEVCAARVAEEDGIELEEATKKVRESNRKRGKFVWDMFHRRLNDPTHFDLVINTDKLSNLDAAVDLIEATLKATGLDKPAAAAASV